MKDHLMVEVVVIRMRDSMRSRMKICTTILECDNHSTKDSPKLNPKLKHLLEIITKSRVRIYNRRNRV